MSDTPELRSDEPGAETPEASIRRRLEALDDLRDEGAITGAEHAEARRRVLAEITGARPGAMSSVDTTPIANSASSEPPPPPPADPPARRAGGQSWDPNRRVAGLPLWALGAIAAAALLGVVIAIIALSSGGSNGPKAPDPAAQAAYVARIDRPLDLLNRSAVAVGKSLGRVSQPEEIKRLNQTVSRQLDVVETARSALSRLSVLPADQRAQRALITAAVSQRRYLVALGRASDGTPNAASLRAIDRARKAGAESIVAYRTFFRLAPAAPDAITTTDLSDTAGLRSAVTKAIADQEKPTPGHGGGTTGRGPISTTSFQSPTGNLRCQVSGNVLFCSSSNDGFGVNLQSVGAPNTGSGIASGGPSVPYGSSWSYGSFRCDSAFDGITCYNASGNGFFLNRDSYNPF